MSNPDWWYDPPDEDDAEFCDECGEEVEWDFDPDYSKRVPSSCDNPLCPSKHEGIAKEMAEKIIELQQDKYKLSSRVKYLEWIERNLLKNLV